MHCEHNCDKRSDTFLPICCLLIWIYINIYNIYIVFIARMLHFIICLLVMFLFIFEMRYNKANWFIDLVHLNVFFFIQFCVHAFSFSYLFSPFWFFFPWLSMFLGSKIAHFLIFSLFIFLLVLCLSLSSLFIYLSFCLSARKPVFYNHLTFLIPPPHS